VPCLAYRLDLERAPAFSPERATALGVPLDRWRLLQQGESVTWPGGRATPVQVLGPPRRGLALGYVTDTRPTPEFPAFLAGVDLLVCEGTYGDSEDQPKAIAHGHMTFAEAAELARRAATRSLWLTHFSPALADPPSFLRVATDIFPATTVGYSGLTTTLNFDDEESESGA
jgi:ribonuclease Z